MGIEVSGEPVSGNTHHWPVTQAGEAIGHVTSCIYSPRLKKNIGIAMLNLPYTANGTSFEIESPEGALLGSVAATPTI